MWSFILSGLVYIGAYWAASVYLKNIGLERGSPSSILCGCFALALSWMAGAAVDWVSPPAPSVLSKTFLTPGETPDVGQEEEPDPDAETRSKRHASRPAQELDTSALTAAIKALKE